MENVGVASSSSTCGQSSTSSAGTSTSSTGGVSAASAASAARSAAATAAPGAPAATASAATGARSAHAALDGVVTEAGGVETGGSGENDGLRDDDDVFDKTLTPSPLRPSLRTWGRAPSRAAPASSPAPAAKKPRMESLDMFALSPELPKTDAVKLTRFFDLSLNHTPGTTVTLQILEILGFNPDGFIGND